MSAMDRLPHGYTNSTRRLASDAVEKCYDGVDREAGARRELACLTYLADVLPVPPVLEVRTAMHCVVLGALPGRHGQELIDEGRAEAVLHLVGRTLRDLRAIPTTAVPELDGDGPVLVHGDFGPQNMLFDADVLSVTAILDWEWAHLGDPIEDLAWAEWIVRMHHCGAIDALDSLFSGVAEKPGWTVRHDAMARRCREILVMCETARLSAAAAEWRQRLDSTEHWSSE
jgi:aminoglycoside phosphotransferase